MEDYLLFARHESRERWRGDRKTMAGITKSGFYVSKWFIVRRQCFPKPRLISFDTFSQNLIYRPFPRRPLHYAVHIRKVV